MNATEIPTVIKQESSLESDYASKKEEILDPDSRWLLGKTNWFFAGVLIWLTYHRFQHLAERILDATELTKFQAIVIVFIILAWTLLVLTGLYFLLRRRTNDDWQ